MGESELRLPAHRGFNIRPDIVVRGVIDEWKRWQKIEHMRPQIQEAVGHLVEGRPILFPGQGVYVLLIDGNNQEAIMALRNEKGRRQDQREATVVPPSRLFQMVDFDRLNKINPQINRKTIKRIYDAHPSGLIVPCLEESTPSDLITYHEKGGERIATIMNIWLARYQLYKILWEELSKYPKVLLAGSSANRTGFASPIRFVDAYQFRANFVASSIAVQDPHEDLHFYQGSHDVLSLITNPPEATRIVSVDPVRHPREFQKFRDVLPNLVVPKR